VRSLPLYPSHHLIPRHPYRRGTSGGCLVYLNIESQNQYQMASSRIARLGAGEMLFLMALMKASGQDLNVRFPTDLG